jgi:arsenate reductase
MFTIYHNPRCKKSRAGLQYLREKGLPFQVVEYLKDPLTKEALHKLLQQLNLAPGEVVRKQEEMYRKELKGKQFSREEWIDILVESPKLLQRPIILKGHKAVVADPPENLDPLL